MAISDELKNIKKRTGVTARHLASMCGVTEATIWNWINGTYVPPADKMDIIREFFENDQKKAS